MAILTLSGVNKFDDRVTPKKDKYDTNVVLQKEDKLGPINRIPSGKRWKVDYYNQRKIENQISVTLDGNLPSFINNYTEIRNLILFLDSELDGTSNDLTGSATIDANIVPLKNDIIVTTVADNRKALFKVTSVTKESFTKSDIFKIEFTIDSFLDIDDSRYKALKSKIAKTLVYDEEFLKTNSSPLLLEEELAIKRELEVTEKEIIKYYLDNYFVNETLSYTLDGLEYTDSNLVSFFKSLVNSNIDNRLGDIRALGKIKNTNTIFEVVKNLNPTLLKNVDRYYMYSLDNFKDFLINSKFYSMDKMLLIIKNRYDKNTLKETLVDKSIPGFPNSDGTYIFTENFYNEDYENCTLIEKMVLDIIKGNDITNKDILALINEYREWSYLDTYYFIPFLIAIINYFKGT